MDLAEAVNLFLLALGVVAVTIHLVASLVCVAFYRRPHDVDQVTLGVFLAMVFAILV